ncbi:MAG: hypothetical protein V3U87_14895 [Methylococcaceae bacterium]
MENTLCNGIDSDCWRVGLDWAGENVLAVILKMESAPYPVGNLSWNWNAGDHDTLVRDNARTPYGDAVNAFIDAGKGVPEPTQTLSNNR